MKKYAVSSVLIFAILNLTGCAQRSEIINNLDKHSLNREASEFINESDDGFYTCTNERDESFSFTIKGRYLAHIKRVGTGIDDSALNGYQYWGMLKEGNENVEVYGIMDSIFPPALKMFYLEKDKNGRFKAFETTTSQIPHLANFYQC
ncbi:hypothetical protein M0K47_000893 [Escherichia coli]|uniref:hypothetical protein n=1 Tax=Escherichia coli TaxID=562 RepID=UPI001067F427|nr:hypothetical protein [Escherichia coli]EEY6114761.1 hypothetical protein [Escherichia coli]EHK6603876.1 hypothetical protein [Escherichia coli]EKX8148036.1 hypothetical protein [Escherichia coli]EMD7206447.1 hypothetical protein [Escherichia coli]MCG4664975.1 hypothetical protein [Escherichia coli]